MANADTVQFATRLLVPEGSLPLKRARTRASSSARMSPSPLSYNLTVSGSTVDQLQSRLSALVESAAAQEPKA